MYSRPFVSLACWLLLSASSVFAQSPKEFSNKIESSTAELYAKASLWGTSFISQYNGKQNYSELAQLRQEMQDYIEEELAYFKEADNVAGGEKLKAAVVAFYQYEKDLVINGFAPFEKLSSNSSDDEINSCRDRLKQEAVKERDYINSVNSERKAFAAQNNISLDAPPPPAPKTVVKKPAPTPAAKQPQPAAAAKPVAKEPVKKAPAKEEDDDKDEE